MRAFEPLTADAKSSSAARLSRRIPGKRSRSPPKERCCWDISPTDPLRQHPVRNSRKLASPSNSSWWIVSKQEATRLLCPRLQTSRHTTPAPTGLQSFVPVRLQLLALASTLCPLSPNWSYPCAASDQRNAGTERPPTSSHVG